MVERAAERMTDYLLEEVGDALRTVVIVKPNSIDITHLADRLQQEYTREIFFEVVDSFRLEDPLFSPDIEGHPIGQRRALVHYHEHAFVLQFPYSDAETILISVSTDVGQDLLGFIEHCRQLVRSET